MKTFTNCAEKKAKQLFNLLQGYTKGIRITAISVILLIGVSNAWGKTIYLYTDGINWPDASAKIWVHAWGSGKDTDLQMTKVKDKLYKADIPEADTKVIFTRTQSTSTGVWDKEWNRVGEQSLNDETPCLKLTDWGTGTWGKISYDAHIYLDNSVANWTEATKEFMIGHSSYSNTYTMTQISNTKLYYLAFSDIWHGYWDYGFIGVTSHWGEWNNKDITTRIKEATKRTGTQGDQVLNGTKLFVPANANNDADLTKTDLSGYSALNYTQTIKSAVKLAGKNYTEANSKATIIVTSYNLTGNGAISSQQSASISTSAKSTTISAARTATTKLSVGTVATGYQFDGWYTAATGGTKLSTSTTHTYYPTEVKTVYARFSEITYSVQVKSADNNQGTTNPANVNAGQFTDITITATPKIGYAFKNWTATTGITITNPNSASTTIKATQAGTVTANFEEKPATTIYLEPTGHWNSDKAVFQAHVWQTGKTGVNLKMVDIGDPSHADGDNKSPYKYYKAEVPYGYDKILFFRKDNFATANANAWNKTGDLTIPTNNNTLYVITDNTTSPATGTWKAADLVYTITLGYCDFGTYGIKYNGQSYFSKSNENVTLDVPAGAQIEILEGQPLSNAYTGDVIKSKPTKEDIGQTLTINGDITLDDNFKTKTSHVVYLGIPDGLTDWTSGTYGNFLWSWNTKSSFSLIESTRNFKIGNTTYYEYTIPAGRHSLCFQRKTGVNDNGTPQKESVYLPFQIPLTDVNCFTLKNEKDGNNRYKGTWGVLPAQVGDYRLLYVEQVVEKSKKAGDEWKPVITRKKAHPSNIIRKGTARQIVSLHTYKDRTYTANLGDGLPPYESSNNPEIILQKYLGNDQWEDVECQMVYGPLETLPIMANLPGRKNASPNSNIDDLQYQDGIENIKKDVLNHQDKGNGVWNFVVTQDGDNASVQWDQTHRYTGEYYIRTDVAEGGWDQYTLNDNYMTRSDVSKQHSNYSHYYCKWISEAGVNVKYTIANDYGIAISDTLEADSTDIWGNELATKMVGDNQLLPAKANVRFSWNEKTNGLHRAYIAGTTNTADRFLVLGGKTGQIYNAAGQSLTEGANNSDRFGLKANEEIFSDIENWVYQTDVQITPGAELQVTAKYNNQVQYFVGKEGVFNNTILQGSGTEKYLVRLLYDFKTNELISAYVPGASTHVDKISTNLMIIRQNYDEAKQLVFNNGDMSTRDNRKAYGVIEFTENYLTNEEIKYLKRCLYWVSFPFDVNLSEAFGSLVYGKHWLIQEYDGARRAAEGLWKESESFWKLHWEPNNITLKAGLGYVIEIDINQMINDKIIDRTDDKEQIAALYFPSNSPITGEIINRDNYIVKIPSHKCNIVRPGTYGDRTIRDSHWNVIGVPSYINKGATFSDPTHALNNVVKYYYQWEGEVDKYIAMEANEKAYSFHSMYAYMVQYAGDITWNSVLLDVEPAQIAAKKNSPTNEHAIRLELQQDNSSLDKTFIRLQDDVVTPAFDFNYDLCKITNKGANIYSIITAEASPVEVAANVMPIEETIIPLGIKLDAAGEYTFAMPDGTDGIVVELIDYETNTRTNMLLDEYSINLGKGTFENRFALHVKPNKTTTSLEDVNTNTTGVKKYLIDGILYMQKDGALYDAQGKLVR